MYKYVLIIVLGFVIAASAQSFLTPEDYLLGIPYVGSLSPSWFLATTDSAYSGPTHPVDIEVLKFSDADYRLVILDAFDNHFTTFRINQQDSLHGEDIIRSGILTDTSMDDAAAMCQIVRSTYFSRQTDRIAVAFWYGAKIGIFRLDDWSDEFILERTFSNPEITKPIGIFWAFDQFFIVDEVAQSIFRTDSLGNIVSRYGFNGLARDGYYWISDIDGYVDPSGTAHLYVCDGINMRVDHLTTTVSDTAIHLFSQVWAMLQDTGEYNTHEVALIPGVGAAAFDRFAKRFYTWDRTDSLQTAARTYYSWPAQDMQPIHIKQACGRLIVASLADSGGWVIRSYVLPGSIIDDPTTLPNDHWTTYISPIYITQDYHVTGELIIDAGVEIRFARSAGLTVDAYGRLIVNGTDTDPVVFHSIADSLIWHGISVKGGSVYMEYAQIMDTDSFCIFAQEPSGVDYPVHLRQCSFSGNRMPDNNPHGAIMIWDAPEIKMIMDSCRIDSVNGKGLDLRNCTMHMHGDTIQNCSYAAGYLVNITGEIEGCRFAGRGTRGGLLFSGTVCDPFFNCCEFENLASQDFMVPNEDPRQATLGAYPGAGPVIGQGDENSVNTNIISDSASTLLWMSGEGALPIIINGSHNNWYQRNAGGVYITWLDNGTDYHAENQYWDVDPQTADFYPDSSGVFNFEPHAAKANDPCGAKPNSLNQPPLHRGPYARMDDPEDLENQFAQALSAEAAGDYAGAYHSFLQIARSTSDYDLRWKSVTHILSTLRHLPLIQDSARVVSLVDSLIAVDGYAYKTRVHGARVKAGYYLDRGAYGQAMTITTDLLQSGLTDYDSLIVALDLVNIQLLCGSLPGNGQLDEARFGSIPAGLHVQSRSHGLHLQEQLMDEFGRHHATGSTIAAVPKTYKLYQNYPNPFNPNTEIRFDLPEMVKVQIKIFNTLGQEVITLIDDIRLAGAYRIMWDSKSASGIQVASGVYIYQIKAGNFVDSRKMMLIR